LLETKLFEPVRNPLHRSSADYPLPSAPAGRSVHILLAKDCSWSEVGAHVVQGSSADIAICPRDVRFGSEADVCNARTYVCFGPKADISSATRSPRWLVRATMAAR
jgi:hypothetical protein